MKRNDKKAEAPKMLVVKMGIQPKLMHEKAITPFTDGKIFPFQQRQQDLFSMLTTVNETMYEGWIMTSGPSVMVLSLRRNGEVHQRDCPPKYNWKAKKVEVRPAALDRDLVDPLFQGRWELNLFSGPNADNEWGFIEVTLKVNEKTHTFRMVVKNHKVDDGTIMPLKRPYESAEQAAEWNKKRTDRQAAVEELKSYQRVKVW